MRLVEREHDVQQKPKPTPSDRRKAVDETASKLTGVYRPGGLEKLRNEWDLGDMDEDEALKLAVEAQHESRREPRT
jgi:hypothetical protein